MSPASDDMTFHAKSQLIHNNLLNRTLQKDFETYKNWHLKTLFGRRSQARTLPDGRVDGPEPLFPPPRRDGFLVRVAPLTLSDYPREHIVN